jgi:hypothetical protein
MPGIGTRDDVTTLLDLFWNKSRDTAYPLTFPTSSESRLEDIFQVAAERMEVEGVAEVYEKMDEAAGNVQRLISVARDAALEQDPDAKTIEPAHLETAMIRLCPIWPFCSKRWP